MKNKYIPWLWACALCAGLVGASGLLGAEQARAEPPGLPSFPQEATDRQEQGKPEPKEEKPAKKVDFTATIKTYLRYGGIDERQDGQKTSVAFSPARQQVGLDIYEATLGVKASLALYLAWSAQVAAAVDLVDFTQLSDRIYLPRHYDSGAIREASLSLHHKTLGRLTVGLTEGIDAKFGLGGHSDLAASGGLDGDFKNTRWAAADIGYALGRAGSENFPKIQYLSSKFLGFQFGLEWFTNAQSPDNQADSLLINATNASGSEMASCPSSQTLYFPRDTNINFDIRRNDVIQNVPSEKAPLIRNKTDPLIKYLMENPSEDPPENPFNRKPPLNEELSNEELCWRLSPTLERWNAQAKRAIQGGGVGLSYTYEYKDALSLSLAARYGIVFENARITNASKNNTIYKVNLQEQAAGAGVSLRWDRYRFAIGGSLLFPSRYRYEQVGGVRGSDSGTYGWSWSLSTSILGFHTRKRKRSGLKEPPRGTFSVAVVQGEIREHPEKDLGKVFLFSAGLDYPIGDHVSVLFDYWYGDAVFFYRKKLKPLPKPVSKPALLRVPLYDLGISLEHAMVFGLRAEF